MLSSLLVTLVVSCSFLQPVASWWDNGHMLVGAVARELMENKDIDTIETALSAHLEGPEGGMADIITGCVWADQIKCSQAKTFCRISTLPSLKIFDKWHYSSKCIPVNYYPASANPCPQQDRYDKGIADIAVASLLETFTTSQSLEGASFAIRMISHIYGDIHQPLHAANGVDVNHPGGDIGGNARLFQQGCISSNLHALWDSGGMRYPKSWAPPGKEGDAIVASIVADAKDLVGGINKTESFDTIHFASLSDMTWEEAIGAMTGAERGASMAEQVLEESAEKARRFAYAGLDLNPDRPGGLLLCPDSDYLLAAQNLSAKQVTLGGYRLSFVLAQIARQMRSSGIMNSTRGMELTRMDEFPSNDDDSGSLYEQTKGLRGHLSKYNMRAYE